MQSRTDRNDLRVVKTTKVLNAAMYSLLERQPFKKITVRDICDEALISRATFYARFSDKYDFLKNWLATLIPDGVSGNDGFEALQRIHNEHFNKHRTVFRNLIIEIDCETLEIMAEFCLSYFMLDHKYDMKQSTTEQIVLSRFFAGGILFYTMWQVKSRFPTDITPMNKYLYELVRKFSEWELETFR